MILKGGSGRTSVQPEAKITGKNGEAFITIVWNSRNFDYMVVNGKKYLNEKPGSNSTFTFPVTDISRPVKVIANTIAMSVPHEVSYEIEILY